MKIYNYFEYVPMKFKANENEQKVRRLVFDFKNGKTWARDIVTTYTANLLMNRDGANNTVFVCVPASNAMDTTRRYKIFCETVCKRTGLQNGFSFISVYGSRTKKHNIKQGMAREDNRMVVVDSEFFKGKNVIIFDDLITRGIDSGIFARMIEKQGGHVLGGMFLARTKKYN